MKGFLPCKSCHHAYNPGHPNYPELKVAYHSKCFQCHRGMPNGGADSKLLTRVKKQFEVKKIGRVGTDPSGCAKQCHAKRKG